MPFEALLLLLFLGAALASFFFELLPVDVTALCLLVALLVSGLVTLDEATAGFSNSSVLTIGALFILGHALVRTGLLEVLAERLSRRFGHRRWLALGVLLLLVALGSALLNNTAVVAMTIPLAMDLCRRLKISPSQVLIPLSFAAIFGGTLTLIGTSTNLLVSGVLEQQGVAPLGMFEMTPMGVVFLVVGLGYVLLVGPRLLPDRAGAESLTGEFEMGGFLTELRVPGDSKLSDAKLIGKTVHDLRMNERYDVTLLAVVRGPLRYTEGFRNVHFRPGDVLVVRGATAGLVRLRNETGVALQTDSKLGDEELAQGRRAVVEAVVGPTSDLMGRTLGSLDFRRTFGTVVLAIRRDESTLHERLAHTPLRFGDTLLLVTDPERLPALRQRAGLLITTELPELDSALRRHRLWWMPVVLIPVVMALAAFGVIDLLVGVLAAVVLLFALRVIRPQESYDAVEWRVVIFIAAFIPVGDAMLRTGLADLLGTAVLVPSAWVPAAWAPWVAVSLLYLVTSLATEAVSNNAAAIILTPVALSMALALDVEPRALVLAVCFAASASFMTPTGYQTNMMVYGAGNYRFLDFTKIGAPLNFLFWVVASVLLPVLFPFG